MKSFIAGLAIGLAVFYLIFYFKDSGLSTEIDTQGVIQTQLKNVSEFIVSEGHFSDILTYKDAKTYYLDWLTAEKKAVVLVKAKATLSYNLKELDYFVEENTNTIVLTHIPNLKLNIYPTLEYYDIEQGYLNPFKAEDYNAIDKQVKKRLQKQIENSNFKENAQNRLISELYSFLGKGTNQPFRIIMEDPTNTIEKLIE